MPNRVISINQDRARGTRLPTSVQDEVDALGAKHVNSPSTSTRGALDGRYRTVMATRAPGCVDITTGTGTDDGGEEPISVSDEAVTALILETESSTRHALDSLYSDDDVITDSDIATLVSSGGSATRTALVTLINSLVPEGGTADDEDIAALIQDTGSLTRAAINALAGLPPELRSGPAPAGAPHANAGTGAAIVVGGTRIAFRCTITTGAEPIPGGVLAVFTLVDYTQGPVVMVNPRDAQSYNTKPYLLASNTQLQIIAAGEVDAFTAYTFDVMVQGY